MGTGLLAFELHGASDDGSAWITDCQNELQVRRSGSWNFSPEFIRSSSRDAGPRGDKFPDLGFRVARDL
jgi:formylglycine-generating enzyme required for sulfatase activity